MTGIIHLEGDQWMQQEAHHEHGGFVKIVEHYVNIPCWVRYNIVYETT